MNEFGDIFKGDFKKTLEDYVSKMDNGSKRKRPMNDDAENNISPSPKRQRINESNSKATAKESNQVNHQGNKPRRPSPQRNISNDPRINNNNQVSRPRNNYRIQNNNQQVQAIPPTNNVPVNNQQVVHRRNSSQVVDRRNSPGRLSPQFSNYNQQVIPNNPGVPNNPRVIRITTRQLILNDPTMISNENK